MFSILCNSTSHAFTALFQLVIIVLCSRRLAVYGGHAFVSEMLLCLLPHCNVPFTADVRNTGICPVIKINGKNHSYGL